MAAKASDSGPIDWRRRDYYWRHHHKRFTKYVESRKPPLICQDCCGSGGEVEPVCDDGSGPFITCGWCEGVGYVTSHIRGQWLSYKKAEKREWGSEEGEHAYEEHQAIW